MKRRCSVFIVFAIFTFLFCTATIIYAGDCPYSFREIEDARDNLSTYADMLFRYPLNDKAFIYLEVSLIKVNEIESITGCEGTIRIFANAKLKAQQAKDMRDFHSKMRDRQLDMLKESMESLTESIGKH